MKLNIDYVSDLHLTHYISKKESITKIDKLVQDKISMQVKGDILVIAGDIDEDINRVSELLYSCSKYYKKVIFVLGNHEYYIPVIKYIYTDPMAKEYNYNSMNKVYRLNEIFKDNNNIIILDKTNNTKGLYTYNTFLLAGDTLWYKPVTLVDKLYNYPMQNDSRFILSELSKKDKIQKLHNDSISWYNNLPNNIDLIMDVNLDISVVLGRTKKSIKDILALGNGSLIELDRLAEEPVEILVNGKRIAYGEVVVVDENFGVRITSIVSGEDRIKSLSK